MADYQSTLPPEVWAIIGPRTIADIDQVAPLVNYKYNVLARSWSAYLAWLESIGKPLTDDAIFNKNNQNRYIANGMPKSLSKASKAASRTVLNKVTTLLAPSGHREQPQPPIGRRDPQRPYTQNELRTLEAWPASQTTQLKRTCASIILAGGLGAGLAAAEMMSLAHSSIQTDDLGVLLTVNGDRPRVVPVLGAWEGVFLAVAATIPLGDPFLLRPHRTVEGGGRNALNSLISSMDGELKPNSARMRATWLVGHLNNRVPLRALLRAAGVENAASLDRYLPFVHDISRDDYRASLRRGAWL